QSWISGSRDASSFPPGGYFAGHSAKRVPMAAASTLCENPLIYGTFRSVTGFQRGAATRECCIAAHFCAGDRRHCATAQPSSPIGGGGFGIPHVAALMLLPVCLKIR